MSEPSHCRISGQDLLPVFLGAEPRAYRLAARLFRQYGVRSVIADKKPSLRDFLSPYTRFFALPLSGDPTLSADLLADWASKRGEALPLLILCKEEYRPLTEIGQARLETHFILLEADRLREAPFLADFSASGGFRGTT